jgi:hypothetical protein
MTTLYNLTSQLEEIANSDFDEETIKDTLEGLEGEFNGKVENIVKLRRNLESSVKSMDDEIARLAARKKVTANKIARLMDYLQSNMDARDIKSIPFDLFTVTNRKGKDVVAVDNEDLLPDEYVKVKVSQSPDKVSLLKALKELGEGETIPGAHIEKGKSSITIK